MSIKGLIDQVVRGSTSSPAHPAEQGDYAPRDKSRDSAKYFSLEVSTAQDDVLRYLQHSLAFTLVIGVVLFAATASTKFWSGEGVYDAQALFRMAAESNSGKQILLHRITGAVNIHGKVDFSEQIIFQSERGATESYLTRRLPLANEHGEIEYTFKPVRVRHTYGDLQKLSPEREMEVKQNPINGFVILGLGEDKRPFSPGINEITLQYSAKGIVSEKEGELSLSWNPLEERHYNTRNLEIIITNLTGQQLHP
ncbi:MAG: hypothetical protein KDD64_11665, partial [Bdellovibrionales bacterium]|nr:hypothetical protein [Bdellovibrionales bacterium]